MQPSNTVVPKTALLSRLGRKIAFWLLLFSSCFTLVSTSIQLLLDYRSDMGRIEQQFENISSSYLQTITLSVWALDESQIDTQLLGLSQLPDIEYAAIELAGEVLWQQDQRHSTSVRRVEWPLIYASDPEDHHPIGTLVVIASIDNVYQRLLNKAGVILVSNGIKTFLVSGFILLLVWLLISKPLKMIADYIATLDFTSADQPLAVNNRHLFRRSEDEIDIVVDAINQMRTSLKQAYMEEKQLVAQRDELLVRERNYKEHLEELVSQRTQQLQDSVTQLESTQEMLVESEKMAALGSMVAGVAHEINTPIGVCRTAASFQGEGSRDLRQKLTNGALTQSDLVAFLDDIDEASALFELNIVRASKLISSFKQIAVDQSHDDQQLFGLKQYIESSIQTISPNLKQQQIEFELDIPAELKMNSYPGALHQVFVNLIQNSAIHGFDQQQGGKISISAREKDGRVTINYRDNGCGLTEEERQKLFEPFFTTRRGMGGSGLGMSILFNIVAQQLRGQVEPLKPNTSGFNLLIHLPTNIA